MIEQWCDIEGFESLYRVSSHGRVYSMAVGTFLGGSTQNSGYRYVHLHGAGNVKRVAVHRLVAAAFIPRIEGKKHVNHKDADRLNNRVENLEWCTPQENAAHKVGLGRSQRRLSAPEVLAIAETYRLGSTIKATADKHLVETITVRNIVRGITHRGIGLVIAREKLPPRGEVYRPRRTSNPRAVSQDAIKEIQHLRSNGRTIREIARLVSISKSVIHRVVNGGVDHGR